MASYTRTVVWWDRDVDQDGRPIRQDVRHAGHELWGQACKRTQAIVGDCGPAAEIMENCVAQVSHYLDRVGAPESSPKEALLMLAFSRGLRRYGRKLSRLRLVGGSGELSNRSIDHQTMAQLDAYLDIESIVRQLSPRNGSVLMLRAAGFEWKEIAPRFGISAARVRNDFWREIKKIR